MSTPLAPLALNTGHEMPAIGFGTWQVGRAEVAAAAEAGYQAFDTATFYGNERDVALGIKDARIAREDVFLTTKVWQRDMGFDSTLRVFDESRRNLQVDVVDLYLIHWPHGGDEKILRTWEAMEKLLADGAVYSIGVSNFEHADLDLLAAHCDVVPAVNQIERHPLRQRTALTAENGRRGIVTSAWSPIGQGGPVLDDRTLGRIARDHGSTPAQVALRWAIDGQVVPLPRSSKPSRIAQNLDVADLHLTDDDRSAIDALAD